MIRFICLDGQITQEDKEFAFYDTVIDKFIEFYGNQTWYSAKDFIEDYKGDSLNRFLKLIPQRYFV